MPSSQSRSTDLAGSLRWYVVRTKIKQEDRAASNLQAWGVETFAPRIRQRCTHRHKKGWCIAPLFPQYVFARFDVGTLLSKIRNTRGVQDLVGFGECATPVDDSVIETIRGRMRADGFVRVSEPTPGDVVEVVDGPLSSIVGIFDRELSGGDRVLILLSSLGLPARFQVSKRSIRKAPIRALGMTYRHAVVKGCDSVRPGAADLLSGRVPRG